jgi:hypothetical protein
MIRLNSIIRTRCNYCLLFKPCRERYSSSVASFPRFDLCWLYRGEIFQFLLFSYYSLLLLTLSYLLFKFELFIQLSFCYIKLFFVLFLLNFFSSDLLSSFVLFLNFLSFTLLFNNFILIL